MLHIVCDIMAECREKDFWTKKGKIVMKYIELKKNGTLVAEQDIYDGFIYLYTDEIWSEIL